MTTHASRFIDGFFEEAEEHISAMQRLALQIDAAAPAAEELDAIFREAHSLKGGAGTFGFRALAEATHAVESLLDDVRKRQTPFDAHVMQAILDVSDVLAAILNSYRFGDAIDPEIVASVERVIAPLRAQADTGLFDDSTEFGLFEDEPEVRVVEQPAKAATGAQSRSTQSIRVDLQKIDGLINAVGELVIAHQKLVQQGARFDEVAEAPLHDAIDHIGRHTRELRERVMAVRMVPIGSVFERFPRMVHDLCAQLGKKARLETIGAETELDKGLTERLVDPLTHLIRNALDHGIESAQERHVAGKPEEGLIQLRAAHEGGQIVITVRDDGAGLDRDRIVATARARGIPVAEDASDSTVWNLIFEPGFSTAENVTDVSGRGVGMDVVRRNVLALQGSVEVASEQFSGTSVTVRMPLTLAILDGLSVLSGSETYIVPLTSIIESVPLEGAEHVQIGGDGTLMFFRGAWLPVIDLGKVFDVPDRGPAEIAVVFEARGVRAALLVEALDSQHQVVIKSIEANFRAVPGIAGATVMGTGRVAFILDLSHLLERINYDG